MFDVKSFHPGYFLDRLIAQPSEAVVLEDLPGFRPAERRGLLVKIKERPRRKKIRDGSHQDRSMRRQKKSFIHVRY